MLLFFPNLNLDMMEQTSVQNSSYIHRYPFEPLTPNSKSVKKLNNEFECLSKAIYYESSTQSRKGKEAVAKVILNRLNSEKFPNSICGIVKEERKKNKCQFTPFCDKNKTKPKGKNWNESKVVANNALSGNLKLVPKTLNNALYFHSDEIKPNWSKKMILVARIDDHLFYSEK